MKELSIEEKAKRYDEALKYATIYYKNGNEDMKTMMKTCFPVLVEEGEDERIRNVITDIVKAQPSDSLFNSTKEKCLAWLEKQGEQKPAEVESKFKVGDTIKHLNGNVFHIARIDGTLYISDEGATISFGRENDWELIEQKPAWSKEDEYYCGIIQYILNDECVGKADKENAINWFKSLKDRYTWKPSEEQLKSLQEVIDAGHYTSYPYTLETLYEQIKKLKKE